MYIMSNLSIEWLSNKTYTFPFKEVFMDLAALYPSDARSKQNRV